MKKNIILVGINGVGKSTIAKELYKIGYHMFKLTPLSNTNQASYFLTMMKNGIVFDRWGVIDLAIYRKDETLLKQVKHNASIIKNNNIFIHLLQPEPIQFKDYNDSEDRVVPRPPIWALQNLQSEYFRYIKELSDVGIKFINVIVDQDLQVTLDNILTVISVENSKGEKI